MAENCLQNLPYELRVLCPQDAPLLRSFFLTLSGESLGSLPQQCITRPALETLLARDDTPRFAAVVRENGDERMVGYAYFENWEHPTPGVCVAAADAWMGRGVGRALLLRLIDCAEKAGKSALIAEAAASNMRANRMLARAGFEQQGYALDGKLLKMLELGKAEAAATRLLPPRSVHCATRSGEPFVLRSVREDDAEALYAFFQALGDRGRAFYFPHGSDLASLQKICAEVRTAHTDDRFVAEFTRDGKTFIGGYVFLGWLDHPVMYLGIGAAECLTGQGVGRVMMEFIQRRAREYGRPVLSLTTHPINFAAQKLYKACGFVQIGTAFDGEQLYLCDLSLLES